MHLCPFIQKYQNNYLVTASQTPKPATGVSGLALAQPANSQLGKVGFTHRLIKFP